MCSRFAELGAGHPRSLSSISIGEAVRVHMRHDRALIRYKVARYNHVHKTRGNPEHHFREALVARREWSVLAQIIEAEERRVAAA